MQLARVMGQVVSTIKDPALKAVKLMVVQPLTEGGEPRGGLQVAADAVGDAGPGDLVFLATRKEAAFPFGDLVPVDLSIVGILLTMHDERTNLSKDVAREVRKHFGDQVFQTIVPRNVRLAEAPSYGLPVLSYDIKSRGAAAYLALAREVLARPEMKVSS